MRQRPQHRRLALEQLHRLPSRQPAQRQHLDDHLARDRNGAVVGCCFRQGRRLIQRQAPVGDTKRAPAHLTQQLIAAPLALQNRAFAQPLDLHGLRYSGRKATKLAGSSGSPS